MASFNPHPVTHDNGKPDQRYRIGLEYCGHEKPHYVVRFCDEFVGSSAFYSSALLKAVGHNSARKGAMIVEEVR